MLGIKWVTKQNTLYFRTLLLQGGLPLQHMSENYGKYQDFLLAVLDEQPESIEDFIFKPHITNLLPVSSQNDIIYENCFEIVKSILNDENIYDELLDSHDTLSNISKTLKVRKYSLIRKQRLSKPKNYWLLSFKKDKIYVSLRIGLADTYNIDSLSNILGFEATNKEYQFYLDDDLICVFRKMINGNYKTDWYQQQNQKWNGKSHLPLTYVIKEGEKIEVIDFIQTIPNLEEPSLWSKYSDNEWRLVKGNGISNKQAGLLFPNNWFSDSLSHEILIHDESLSWLTFEGEAELKSKEEQRKYLSEVSSFDWTIVSQKPKWILKTNIPVVKKKPNIIIYDENDKMLPENKFNIWLKRYKSHDLWQEYSNLKDIPLGCIKIKIEKDGLIAHDIFFNIGELQVNYFHKSIDNAELGIKNIGTFEFKLNESSILDIQNLDNHFLLNVNPQHAKIPTSVSGSVGHQNSKKLYFELVSPFVGMSIINSEGSFLVEEEPLSIANLYGLRILSTPNSGTIIRMKNSLKPDVIIAKEIKETLQPIISFREEIVRLYYLSDAMNYKNKVSLELIQGGSSKTFEISGFSHSLDVEEQFNYKVSLYSSNENLDLYAIPLNCDSEKIEIIPLEKEELSYLIPTLDFTNQFIIISAKQNEQQLMPRFVYTDEGFIGIEKDIRIEDYHSKLSEASFEDDIWKQVLSYFNVCIGNDIPFSTFDQIRAISRSSKVLSRAFFFLGANQSDSDKYIQEVIPEIEKDLGVSFHWVNKNDWEYALNEISSLYGDKFFNNFIGLITSYMQEIELHKVLQYIIGGSVKVDSIMNRDISDLRAKLGERVLMELPRYCPKVTQNYGISVKDHYQVKLLIKSPIAVAESITGTFDPERSIWSRNEYTEGIRRNIQYSQYLNPEFYNRTILHSLRKIKDNEL